MTEYLHPEGNRVAKGAIQLVSGQLSCDATQNGFTPTASYILSPGNQQLTEMTWSGGTVQWSHTNVWAAGQLIATYSPDSSGQTAGILNFELNDWLGTRRVLVRDSDLTVQQTRFSLPYGNGETCAPTPTEHLFTGKERDAESGNDYFIARYYSSDAGRFLSPDWSAKAEPVPYAKLDNPQSLNLYSYVYNNPVTGLDLDGHQDQEQAISSQFPGGNEAQYCLWVSVAVGTGSCAEWQIAQEPWIAQQSQLNRDKEQNGSNLPHPVTTITVTGNFGGCDMSSEICRAAYRNIMAAATQMAQRMTGNAPSNGQSYSFVKQWWSDVKSCFTNYALPTLKSDLSPIPSEDAPGLIAMAQNGADQAAQSSMDAAAAWSVSRGLIVPLRSSVVRAGFANAEKLTKLSGVLGMVGIDYALGDAVYAEYKGCL